MRLRWIVPAILLVASTVSAGKRRKVGRLECPAVKDGNPLDGMQEDQSKTMQTRIYVCMYASDKRGAKFTASCKSNEWGKLGNFEFGGDGSLAADVFCEDGH